MKNRKYDEKLLREAVQKSTSIRQVLIALGLKASGGGGYKSIHSAILEWNIDTSHFKGKGWNKDVVIGPKRPIEDYLSNKYPINSYKLKLRLINEGFLSCRCSSCNNTTWQGNPIPLELDHIDGNNINNNLINLRLLCPNCHALTPTHAGKNKGKGKYRK